MIGPQNWGLPHYGGLVGGPVLIYGVRKAITAVSGWSITRQQSHVDRLQKQREEKITELKKATRYDSTQELLQKYGGAPPTPKSDESKQNAKRKGNETDSKPQQQVQRTGIPPPPTANIPGRAPTLQTVRPPSRNGTLAPPTPQSLVQSPITTDEPGFAPNAFSQPPPTNTSYEVERHWYDRVLDLVLGEDETLAKNRLVLICQNCRLVNGQAPPGVKTLEELGRWRCQSCGTWNGIQAEAAQVVREMTQAHTASPVVEPVVETEEEADAKESELIEGQDGSTGRDQESKDSAISRRVTRSVGKAEARDS